MVIANNAFNIKTVEVYKIIPTQLKISRKPEIGGVDRLSVPCQYPLFKSRRWKQEIRGFLGIGISVSKYKRTTSFLCLKFNFKISIA